MPELPVLEGHDYTLLFTVKDVEHRIYAKRFHRGGSFEDWRQPGEQRDGPPWLVARFLQLITQATTFQAFFQKFTDTAHQHDLLVEAGDKTRHKLTRFVLSSISECRRTGGTIPSDGDIAIVDSIQGLYIAIEELPAPPHPCCSNGGVMKTFTFFWRDGTTSIGSGSDPAGAIQSAGGSAKTLPELDFYESGNAIEKYMYQSGKWLRKSNRDDLERALCESSPEEIALREFATLLHKKLCWANHTDGCGWYYHKETNADWQRAERKRYRELAAKIVRESGLTLEQLTKAFGPLQDVG